MPSATPAGAGLPTLVGFLLSLCLLVAAGTYCYVTNLRVAAAEEWVVHSHEVQANLAALYGSLAGAEVALRDYVITAEPADLEEHRRRVDDVHAQLARLRRLTADNTEQQRNIAELGSLLAARTAAMADVASLYADSGLDAARAAIRTNTTQDARLSVIEEHLLDSRRAVSATVRETTRLSLIATLSVACGLIAALFRGIRREILARRAAERCLRASDQYNRSIVDSSPDCLCVLTLDGRLLQLTPQARRLMGVGASADPAGIDWLALWSEDSRPAAGGAIAAARAGADGRFEARSETATGEEKWWDVIVMPVRSEDGSRDRLLSVARDVSAVKRGERELRATNRFLDSLVENLPVMVGVKDATHLRFLRVNHALEQVLGLSREQLLGKSAHELFPAEEAAAIVASDRLALEGGSLLDLPEHRVVTGAQELRIFHTMKVPIADPDGNTSYLLAISTDITERKLAEQAIHELNGALTAKAEQLTLTNRELEGFSYSVSHDLRAPLRAVDGFAQMLEEDCAAQLDAEGRRYLEVIRDNTRRMGELIDDLLEFSRLSRLPVISQDINVEALVREVVAEAVNGQTVRVEIGALPCARGDRGLLRQVWTNLISNAVKYSSKQPLPVIRVSGCRSAAENVYSVRDNGVGFNMQHADKLFGVFQRLHHSDQFSGTGVGLAIVQRIVARHGGRVWAEGKVDHGAVFSFAIPV